MTCALTGGKARSGAISRSARRIISHGLIRKQTLSPLYKFQSTMEEMIPKGNTAFMSFRR
jgi:hypothetical protein